MKINIFKPLSFLLFFAFLVACSTKKDTFIARNSHALSTKYNILYNGQVGLEKGVNELNSNSDDDFWKRLPIEKMQIVEDFTSTTKPKNTNFELAEAKATKAIQKHSMNIGGREKNSQIDEAYLMLGKSRYYDQRFVPALDAFNYILYKYPNSSKIYEAKIWREKTNMRLGNDALAIKNLNKLLKDHKLKKQVFADANALLSESFLNLEEKDSAVAKLKLAIAFTKVNQERARYRFILGQLYQQLGYKDSAVNSYQSVIDMNRKADRKFVIQAHAKKAELFDYQNGDFNSFTKTFDKLAQDRENRPYKDLIFHHMAVFYDQKNDQKKALDFYNLSLKADSRDSYLVASNYRNLGNMYFRNAEYPAAAKYYDSTLVKLNDKTREHSKIKKVRTNLDEVILYEALAKRNDSILNVVSLNESDKIAYFEKYIAKLKEQDEIKRVLDEKRKEKLENIERNSTISSIDPASNQELGKPTKKSTLMPPAIPNVSSQQTTSIFYFYNPSTVAFGKIEFKKVWGERIPNGNWRISSSTKNLTSEDPLNYDKENLEDISKADKIVEQYTTDFYLKQLPVAQTEIDSISKERNFAYYQLGIIYKEKFKENNLAIAKLEQLLNNNPEEKLLLPSMYNLYKLYQITDANKAEAMKKRISAQYPDSRYAQIINNTSPNAVSANETPESVYTKWYKLYQQEQFVSVLENSNALINQFSGDEIVSKFELLKANTIGKLKGVTAYKNALQGVADNYPSSEEGKNALEILTIQVPFLEKLELNTIDSNNWKILYRVGSRDDKNTKALEEKIKMFVAAESYQKIYYSYDIYTEKENFITIHGIGSKLYANDIVSVLKENVKYKLVEPAIVVSGDNYKVIQIKKNIDTYLALKNP
ncbi:type IX secretion system periplasmic lipoprotein PorW/SprE [Flavobacterium glaciei]|uniref:Protein involved in gliding motility SprE n=1 Tax=Flavobacterium glaciei TaxID=386300 RepID=A0A562PY01_9FLAO|nr:tetratricopeptide repeat protein [Flavobacterium glaciei]RDI56470.1 protein involved in gliding motility SprE [Flavobacterium glaciei]TWI49040.1 tetratricopeptide repeat protein [Flavobacterium glaciei]